MAHHAHLSKGVISKKTKKPKLQGITHLQFETMQETKFQSVLFILEDNSSNKCDGQHRLFMAHSININF